MQKTDNFIKCTLLGTNNRFYKYKLTRLMMIAFFIVASSLLLVSQSKAFELEYFKVKSFAWDIALSPDSKILAVASNSNIELHNSETGAILSTLSADKNVGTLDFSPDGEMLISGGWDKTIKVWDVASGRLTTTLKGHLGSISKVIFTSDGKQIISASEDKTIRIWNVKSGKIEKVLKGHKGNIYDIAISPDGKSIASVSGNDGETGRHDPSVKLWDISTGKCLFTLNGHKKNVTKVVFSHNGQKLATASAGVEITIRVWDLKSKKVLNDLQVSSANSSMEISGLMFLPDDSKLISASHKKHPIRVWNLNDGTYTTSQLFNSYKIEGYNMESHRLSKFKTTRDGEKVLLIIGFTYSTVIDLDKMISTFEFLPHL